MKCYSWLLILLVNLWIVSVKTQKTPNVALLVSKLTPTGKVLEFNFTCIAFNELSSSAIVLEPMASNIFLLNRTRPHLLPHELNCEFRSEDSCTIYFKDNWNITDSVTFFAPPVSDRRWEKFPIRHVKHSTQTLLSIDADWTPISFSVKTLKDFSFALDNLDGRSYKFEIRATKIIFFKDWNNIFEVPYTFDYGKWITLALTMEYKEYEGVIIRLYDPDLSEPLVNITDSYNFFRPNKLRASQDTLWKFHIYYVAITSHVGSTFSPPFKIESPKLYLSLYYYICQSCLINIYLYDEINKKGLIGVFQNSEGSSKWKWGQIEIPDRGSSNNYIIYETSQNNNLKTVAYWAIDGISVSETEQDFNYVNAIFRFEGKNNLEEVNCQSIANSGSIIKWQSPSRNTISEDEYCPLAMFGPECKLNCSQFLNSELCEKHTFCSATKCMCSPGYYGLHCGSDCSIKTQNKNYNHYGNNCETACGFCKNKEECHPITGECLHGCTDLYSGPKCDIFVYPVLSYPPEVVTIGSTEIDVKVSNKNYTGENEPVSFEVQFKEKNKPTWDIIEKPFDFDDVIRLSFLKPTTEYNIRVVLYDSDRNFYDTAAPGLTLTTSCLRWTKDLVTFKENHSKSPWKVNLEIDLKVDFFGVCPISSYKINTNASGEFRIFRDKLTIVGNNRGEVIQLIAQFESDESDILNILYSTPEGQSSQIKHLITVPFATYVQLQWEPPEFPAGRITHYFITYSLQAYLGCATPELMGFSETIATENTKLDIRNLIPFSNYKLIIFAVNDFHNGTEFVSYFNTMESDFPRETVQIIDYQIERTIATFKWKLTSKCSEIQGPVSYRIGLNGQFQNTEASYYTFHSLTPFTNYNFTLAVIRLKSNVVNLDQQLCQEFQTKPSVPPSVKDLQVYSFSSNEISFRWKNGSPNYGIIELYQVVVDYKTWKGRVQQFNKNVKGVPCSLWDDFICYTVTVTLYYGYDYFVRVAVKNANVSEVSSSVETSIKISKDLAPSEPENVTVTLIPDQMCLNISWMHPLYPFGKLEAFDIIMTDTTDRATVHEEYKIQQDKKKLIYSKFYFIQICNLQHANTYFVSISSYNGRKGKKTPDVKIIVPPDVPSFIKTPKYMKENREPEAIYIEISPLHNNYTTRCLVLVSVKEEIDEIDSNTQYSLAEMYHINLLKYPNLQLLTTKELTPGIYDQFHLENHSLALNFSYTYTIILVLESEYEGLKVFNTYEMGEIPITIDNGKTKIVNFFPDEGDEYAADETTSKRGYLLFLLLLLIPCALFVSFFIFKSNIRMLPPSLQERISQLQSLRINNQPLNLEVSQSTVLNENPSEEVKLIQNKPTPKQKTDETELVNIEPTYSSPIQLNDYYEYVKESLHNGTLEKQYKLFVRGATKPCEYGSLPENKSKNRYANLVAYDGTRVVLKKLPDDPFSDYINANYIDGHQHRKAYIATQGPKPKTINDFWRMIWQENVSHIVMLTNIEESGKKKCEQYWPKINESKTYGDISVHLTNTQVFADFVSRIFTVSNGRNKRTVEQLHFTTWPDHGVPMYSKSLVPLLRRILAVPLRAPIVIHCSAGVGRTGTIILCDICLRMAEAEQYVDPLFYLQQIRDQRSNLVDNLDQYKLVHLLLVECLVVKDTSLKCSKLEEEVDKLINTRGALKNQLEEISRSMWMDHAMKEKILFKNKEVYATKNRFQDIIPESDRVYITRFPESDENSDYINAVYVDGYRAKDQFIVTQQPMPKTLCDFWQLINDQKITKIVSLNTLDLNDETICSFHPDDGGTIRPLPHLIIKHINTSRDTEFDVISVSVTDKSKSMANQNEKHLVEIIQVNNWPSSEYSPISQVNNIIKMWESTKSCSLEPILVTCYDGLTASGLFVAIAFVIEKIKMEHECDVSLAIRTIRHNRSRFIISKEQLELLYRSAVTYIQQFDIYSNFQDLKS